jgi:hypothetical protein
MGSELLFPIWNTEPTPGCSKTFETQGNCSLRKVVIVAGAFLLCSVSASGQTAELGGTVSDSSGAVVVHARVILHNPERDSKQAVLSNETGRYDFPFLAPGSYRVTVEAAGFRTAARAPVFLEVGQIARMDFVLAPPLREESVRVEDEASAVQTDSAAVGTVINRDFVQELPLNGRSLQALIFLIPGTAPTSGTGQFSVNGQRDDANYFTVDGLSANVYIGSSAGVTVDPQLAGTYPGFNIFGGTNNMVALDALQEFRVQTSSYPAELGRMPGGQVQIVTRSGTNEFHGSVFDYFRNDALDANDWFTNHQGLPRQALHQNDFGGTFGGAILPNHTFFFASYEGLRLLLPQFAMVEVPSLEAREAAPGVIRELFQAYPIPNGSVDPASMLAQFSAAYGSLTNLDSGSLRLDQMVGSNFKLFARYGYSSSATSTRTGNLSELDSGEFTTETFTFAATSTLHEGIFNDVRANYTHVWGADSTQFDPIGGAQRPPDPLIFPFPGTSESNASFYFSVAGSPFFLGRGAENPQRQVNMVDTFTMLKGAHLLKLGADYRRIFPTFGPRQYGSQNFFDTMADALAERESLLIVGSRDALGLAFNNLSLFAGDHWGARPKLTIDYGLRWEFSPPPHATAGQQLFTLESLNNLSNLALAPPGTPLYKTSYASFAPRLGAVYQLSSRTGRETLLRGGFGVFYDLGYGTIGAAANSFPHFRSTSFFDTPYPPSTAQSTPPLTVSLTPPFSSGFNVFAPNHQLPRTFQWNLSIQQNLGPQSLTASYVGAAGRQLLWQEFVFSPNADFPDSSILITTNHGASDYHALQLQFRRVISTRLQLLASYSWAHSIDNASTDNAGLIPSDIVPGQHYRGSSDFDIRHSLNAGFSFAVPAINNGALRRLESNWRLSGIFTARTGQPVDIFVLRFDVPPLPIPLHPDRVAGVPFYLKDPSAPGGSRINPAAFSIPTAPIEGTLGRNALVGPGVIELDTAVERQFSFSQRTKVQLRAEAFNCFNHPIFANPVGALGEYSPPFFPNPAFGVPPTTLANGPGALSPLYRAGGPRSVQLALRVVF